MDPITHGLVGVLIGSKAAGGLTITNGALIASTLGAIAPDFDIIGQFWGDYVYLKQHRVFSHSIPGLFIISLGLSALLSMFFPESFSALFLWTFLGALSHSVMDLFNSYGVSIFWPLEKKKRTLSLLTVFDPLLCILLVGAIAYGSWGFTVPALYICLRFLLRYWTLYVVSKRLKKYSCTRIFILPSLISSFKWDFIAIAPGKKIVGRVGMFRKRMRVLSSLIPIKSDLEKVLSESILGRVFGEFTPFMHIECERVEDKLVARFMDLRYYIKDRFLHNGTIIFDEDMNVEEAIFQPYSPSRRIVLVSE